MKKVWTTIAALAMLGARWAGAADPHDHPEKKDDPKQDIVREAGPRGRMFMFNHAMPAPYWIGAMCVPADDTLRSQLGLDSHEGLVVVQVAPDSPAGNAGLKQHDVIVKVGDDKAADVRGLMKAVNDTGEKDLKIEILRNGKRQTITIKPSKRPEGEGQFFNPRMPEGFGGDTKQFERAREQMEKMLERLPPGEEGNRIREWLERGGQGLPGQPFRIHTFGPGVMMHGGMAGMMPEGVKVTVKKEGNSPARIHIERGDQKWDVAENELDKLPADLRAPIAGMLAPRHGTFIVQSPAGAAAAGVVTSDGGPPRVEIKIEEQQPFDVKVPGAGEHSGPKATSAEVQALRAQLKALEARVNALEKPAEKPKADNPKPETKKPETKKSEPKKKSKDQA